jgi:DNA polymerase I-like protein with 3'-5' exonuclease and polymerase domains
MGEHSLARRMGCSQIEARELLRLHRSTYATYWKWSDGVVDYAMLHGKLWTPFGWTLHVGREPNPRSLANFPMQAAGAEILRLACIAAVEEEIEICAPVHDAVLICAPLEVLDDRVTQMQAIMAWASRTVLDGFELATDVEIVRYPDRYQDRYQDPRGVVMWSRVMGLIEKEETDVERITYDTPTQTRVQTGSAGPSILLS